LCNWGTTLKQSSALHIQALVSADVILLGISSKLQLLFINLASVPGGQLVNSPTAQSLERWQQVMRPLLLIIALTVSKLSFSQSSQDTAIQKRQLDSIESVVYKLKDSLRRTQYENNVLINCYTVDTTIYGKDSIIIRYKSKSGKLIKIYTKNNLQSDGLYDYEKLEYLNGMERPVFIEHWEQARSSNEENDRVFTWKVYSYERFVYDDHGRVIIWIKFRPEISRRRVQRYDYSYNSDNKQTSSIQKIDVENFWDN